jgi:uncharacterized membrane protein SirB2
VQTPSSNKPATADSKSKEFTVYLRAHLYRAKLIVYTMLLIAGVTQIIIREHYPELHPAWPWIAGILMVLMLGIVFVPPVLHFLRSRRKSKSDWPDDAPNQARHED